MGVRRGGAQRQAFGHAPPRHTPSRRRVNCDGSRVARGAASQGHTPLADDYSWTVPSSTSRCARSSALRPRTTARHVCRYPPRYAFRATAPYRHYLVSLWRATAAAPGAL